MTQDYKLQINREIQNLVLNYPNRAIRSTTDYNVVTVGRLQIENLDWRWQPEGSKQLKTYLEWDPFDWMSPAPFNKFSGNFVVTKYGLSYREKPLTLASYTPLWTPGIKPEEQAKIMWTEMQKMAKDGSKKCENGIEIVPESPLWNTVDTLATKVRNTFRTGLGQKVQDLESRGVKYDGEKVWDGGVPVTLEIANVLKSLSAQMSK